MSKYIVKDFSYFNSGKKSKIIKLDIESEDKKEKMSNMTFICDIGNNDKTMNVNENYNKSSLFDSETGKIIHNLYDIKDICLKSNIRNNKPLKNGIESFNSDNYIDIYGPQLTENLIDFVQIGNSTYCLSKSTNYGPSYKGTTLKQQRDNASEFIDTNYKDIIQSENLKTYTYGSNTYSQLSDNFQTRINFENIKYNYIIEIPLEDEFNDFDSGDVHADIFQTKNVYDSYYSMNMSSQNSILNCRDYCGIGNGCGTIYLKYYDSDEYQGYFSKYENNISVLTATKLSHSYDFQKIETLTSINRFKDNIRHKSNLYSIEIKDTGLNNNDESSEKLKQDIKNNIREITKKITPANTQLFDIFFSGV